MDESTGNKDPALVSEMVKKKGLAEVAKTVIRQIKKRGKRKTQRQKRWGGGRQRITESTYETRETVGICHCGRGGNHRREYYRYQLVKHDAVSSEKRQRKLRETEGKSTFAAQKKNHPCPLSDAFRQLKGDH